MKSIMLGAAAGALGGRGVLPVIGGGALALLLARRVPGLRLLLGLGAGYAVVRMAGGRPVVPEAVRERLSATARPIRVSRSVTIRRPREEVYRLWRDVQNLPRFMAHLVSVTAHEEDGRRSRWVARRPGGGTVAWEAEIEMERENELLAWRSLPGSKIDNAGRVRFQDAPGGRGTEVMVDLVYDAPAGRAGAAVARLLGESPDQQVREDLRHLKQILEAGEAATVDGQPSGRAASEQTRIGSAP